MNPQSERVGTILVARSSARLFRADVAISRLSEKTELHIRAGGLSAPLKLVNVAWIERKVRRVLRSAPALQ